jgi:signal transduction histidine kinase
VAAEQAINDANNQLAVALENARQLTQEAQAADRLKSQILAHTSHELRTPLTSILGALGLLESRVGDDPVQRRKFLALTRTSASNLLNIVNDLLAVARIEAGQNAVEPAAILIKPTLSEAHSLMGARADEKGLRLEPELPSTLLPPVWADPGRLREIMDNLLNNALKFTERGRVTVRAWTVDSRVIIEVEDTGIGVPVEQQARLFQPFVQLHSGPTHKYGGTGLGLSIARKLAELMHGSLAISSGGENQGSTLTLWLPIVTEENISPVT